MSPAHAKRREIFLQSLGEKAAAVVAGHREQRRNSDVYYPFRQHSDLLYLTGFPEPEALAVLTPGKEHRFTLFVLPRDPKQEVWTGRRAGVEGARAQYGADQAFPVGEIEARMPELLNGCEEVWLHLGEDPQIDALVIRALAHLRRHQRHGMRPPSRLLDLRKLLHEQRLIKDEEALSCLRRAAEITAEAHGAARGAARVGASEYELEALIDYTFRRHGGHPGYGTIVGAGRNATILHYVTNSDPLLAGQLVLIDAGCEWRGFTADVTRTYPIADRDGRARFSPPQRRVYDVVLAAQLAGIEEARPGRTIEDIHNRVTEVLTEGLVDLGLLAGKPSELIEKNEQKRYYLHRTSHWLGMDVHDVGEYAPQGRARQLVPGMVLTVEPGLYVADDEGQPAEYRGIGVRIEDDVLITADGNEVLTRAIPKHPGELER